MTTSIALLGLFVLKFVFIRKYNNLIAVCKNIWFFSQIKKYI